MAEFKLTSEAFEAVRNGATMAASSRALAAVEEQLFGRRTNDMTKLLAPLAVLMAAEVGIVPSQLRGHVRTVGEAALTYRVAQGVDRFLLDKLKAVNWSMFDVGEVPER